MAEMEIAMLAVAVNIILAAIILNKIRGMNIAAKKRRRADNTLLTLASIVESSGDAIISKNLDGTVISWNDGAARIFGYSREEIIGRNVPELFPPERQNEELEIIERILRGESIEHFETVRVNKGGWHIPVSLTVSPLKDTEGKVVGISKIARDITERKNAEEALMKSEERFQLITRATNDTLWDWNLITNEIWWNENFFKIFGYREGEVEHTIESWRGRLHPEDAERIEHEIHELIESCGQTWTGKYRFRRRDGSYAFVVDRAYILFNEQNRPVRMLGSLVDITERRQIEDALQENQRTISTLMSNLPGMAYRCLNDEYWTMEFTSDGALDLTGYLPSELMGNNKISYSELIHPEDQEIVWNNVQAALTENKSFQLSYRIRTRTGDEKWVWEQGQGVFSLKGELIALEGFITDITERKRIESALDAAAKRERAMFENALDVICSIDAEGKFTSVSPACFKVWGYQPEELVGRLYIELVASEDVAKTNEVAAAIMSGLETTNFENRYQHKDGCLVHIMWTAYWSFSEQLMFCVARDISERKRIELELERARDAAIESARHKSEFLANMSHEIRTPMNGVIGMTGLLLDTELDVEQSKYAQTIRSSGEALLKVINDILDFSKVEAGKLDFETLDFNLRDIVESTIELFTDKARETESELTTLVYADVPLNLRGDSGRLRQILTNLISNALKFTKKGEVNVRVRREEETETHSVLRFSVTDTGIGIAPENLARLFQPFSQADASTTRQYGGTGLGLVICQRLVEMMNGEIGVESVAKKGSTFWFIARFEKQDGSNSTQSIQCEKHELEALRVLIVDDNAVNREVLQYQTRNWGMKATEVDSGADALKLLHAAERAGERFDVVILDLHMPEMNGFELAEKINLNPEIKSPKLILLSSGAKRGEAQRARQVSIDSYLSKPFRQEELLRCLRTLMIRNEVKTGKDSLVTRNYLNGKKVYQNNPLKDLTDTPFSTQAVKSPRILIVEDNPINQLVAKTQLNKFGYRTDVAANGIEALDAIMRIPYDLVLMDCQMPEMDGYEATAEIRLREKAGATRLPVIAMTAHAIEGEREKCLAAGMDDYLSKPVQKEALRQTVEHWLNAEWKTKESIEESAATVNFES